MVGARNLVGGVARRYQNMNAVSDVRLAEFDFRYSNRIALGITDAERADKALKGITGRRLTYRRINGARYA